MKKLLFSFVMLGAFAFMTSCSSSSGDGGQQPNQPSAAETYANQYFTVQNGTFHEGSIPSASAGASALSGVTMNNQALKSGSNLIGISSAQAYQKFYIGIQGVDGYVEVPAVSRANNVYVIPLIFGSQYGSDITILVVGLTTNGTVTQPFVQLVKFVENSLDGNLHVNLTFDQAKDVDLHLITPSGHDIYYGDRTISTTNGTETIEGGLDHDSNAGCTIDNLNNENIVLPAALIEPGEYTVEIDMWSNCSPIEKPINWTINARYNGAFVTNALTLPTNAENQALVQNKQTDINGSNPVYGTYPYDATSNRNSASGRQKVMKFTIQAAPAAAPRIIRSYVPTDMDQMKMEEETWYHTGVLK